jgi:hypothetical protein
MESFFKNMNSHYDNLKKKISKKINIDEKLDFIFNEDSNLYTVDIMINNKLIMKAEYSIIGMYNLPLSIWYWGWAIDFVNHKLTQNLKPVKKYKKKIPNMFTQFEKSSIEEAHYILSNNNFYISNQNIDKIMMIVLYLTESLWYFPIYRKGSNNHEFDKIDYILITKILQYN